MSTKYWLGGAALAGASYYVYQHRTDQPHTYSVPGGPGIGEKTGRQIDQAAADARGKFRNLQDDAERKVDTGLARLERERADAVNWTSDKLSDAADSLSTTAKDAQSRAKSLAHEEESTGFKKLGHDIKQTAIDAKHGSEERLSSAKDSVVDGVSSLKSSIIGGKNRVEDEANKAVDTTSGWFKSGESKADEIARNAQRSLEGWSETAKQNADAYYDSLHGTKKRGEGFFRFAEGETEQTINKAYAEAEKAYKDAQKRLSETKSSWFSWSQDDQKKKLHEEAERQFDIAQHRLDQAGARVTEWKEQAKQALQNKDRSPGFYNWLRGGTPAQEEEWARNASQSLRGWGESAEQFSRDELDYVSRDRQLKEAQERIDQKLNSWSKWANKKYEASANGAQEYYNDAQEAYKDAEKEFKKTTKSWWNWGAKKSDELDAEAKRNYEDSKVRLEQAQSNLSKWSNEKAEELNTKFWSGADKTIHQTKKGIDTLSDKAIDRLDDAQKWVKDKK